MTTGYILRTAIFTVTVYVAVDILLIKLPYTAYFGSAVPVTFLLYGEIIKTFTTLYLLGTVVKTCDISLAEVGLFCITPFRETFLGLVAGAILWVLTSWILARTRHVLPDVFILPQIVITSLDANRALFFMFGLLASVTEEVFFRGILYSVLKKVFSIQTAIIVSSGLFGILHGYLPRVIPIFVAGCIYALLRERRGSLLAPTIAHITLNFMSLAVYFGR
jgi:uncharacterized protein